MSTTTAIDRAQRPAAPSQINRAVKDQATMLASNGYLALLLVFAVFAYASYLGYSGFSADRFGTVHLNFWSLGEAGAAVVAGLFLCGSIYSLQPNESAVLTLFGSYVGTDSTPGLRMTVPLFDSHKVSQRVQFFECPTLKVNDLVGNPIEIGAVIVWRVADCASALFQIDDYVKFVGAQTEAALRHMASQHPYDFNEAETADTADKSKSADASKVAETAQTPTSRVLSLRECATEVTKGLIDELRQRLQIAGVIVDEARITHLAYAPEIAPVMLRRQQATAVIAARKQIVKGAVEIVQEALTQIESSTEIKLDPERKAAMVSNLLVVLVSDKDASPVINTGTLYG